MGDLVVFDWVLLFHSKRWLALFLNKTGVF